MPREGRQSGQLSRPGSVHKHGPYEKGRARSYDRVRDPLIRICPYGEAYISTSNEVGNKYKHLFGKV